ncbi:SORC2 protein, partial [Polypterus senegalus]
MVTAQYLGKIDQNSLAVQDDYIFVKVTTGNRTKYYVSYRRNEFVQMKFPKYALPKDVQIVSTDESQVFLALQEWYQTDTYNLYQSDPQGVYYSIVLENVRSTKQPEENVLIDILEVRGVKGVFLANQKVDGKVMTLITYNKGRDWDFLNPPSIDMNGKTVNCKPRCLGWRPGRDAQEDRKRAYVHFRPRGCNHPGSFGGHGYRALKLYPVGTRGHRQGTPLCLESPGLLHFHHTRKFWGEEDRGHPECFRVQAGASATQERVGRRSLMDTWSTSRFSIDEGQTWNTHNFTSTSVFVDGLLSEPGDETLVMTVFGHISFRSDWELVKVDFRQSFPRQCTEADYDSWKVTNLQDEPCIMGQERSFRKRKDTALCIKGKSFTSALTFKPCQCSEKDFNCDYGFERAASLKAEGDRCFADFWHDPDSPPDDCVIGQSYASSTGYRKVVSNICEGGVNKQQSSKQHTCPLLPPRGLQLGIKGETLAVGPSDDITFIVRQEQGDTLNTKYQVDLGDGFRAIYVNLTVTDEPIQHRYEKPGIYRVTVKAENVAGHDEAVVYIQVNPPLQEVHLEVVPVAGRNQEVNLTAVVLPARNNLTVFYWWIGNNLQPILSLANSLITKFPETGEVSVTVQASCGRSMVQDTKLVRVFDQFQALPLKFSKNLDAFNPNIPEWREDIGQVVTKAIAKITDITLDDLVTVVKPGLPTTADLYVLPPESTPKKKRSLSTDKRIPAIKQILNSNNVSFIVRGGLVVLVSLSDLYLDSHRGGIGSGFWALAVIFVISLVAVGAFILYKFKRKMPGRNVYAQMHNEKEQEMTSPVNHSEDTQNIIQGEEFIDDDLDSQTLDFSDSDFDASDLELEIENESEVPASDGHGAEHFCVADALTATFTWEDHHLQ